MLFNSWEFFLFLPTLFIIYYLPLFKRFQVVILVLGSLVFYSFAGGYILLLLLFIIGLNVIIIKGFERFRSKPILYLGVVINILLLVYFKYSGLVIDLLPDEVSSSEVDSFLVSIPLPLGISFYIFQLISILVDISRRNNSSYIFSKDKYSLSEITFTTIFFPKIISGPLLRIKEFSSQITIKYLDQIDYYGVFKFLVLGYFFKVFVADNLSFFTTWISYPEFTTRSGSILIFYMFAYSIQIFSDFAGYTMIAIGVGKLFGYDLPRNFNFPYISKSITEFWRRWHITLSTWLKDYLYIPLGGNRKGKVRTYINLIIVMTLGGLWHGSTWGFAVWGLFHGLGLAIERFVKLNFNIRIKSKVLEVLQILFYFSLISILWLFFRIEEIDHIVLYIKKMFDLSSLPNTEHVIGILIFSFPIIIYHIYGYLNGGRFKNLIFRYKFLIFAIMIILILFNAGDSSDFIYFQF